MTAADLDHLLAVADEVDGLARRLREAEAIAAEIAADDAVVSALPAVLDAARAAGSGLEPVVRELEREWVDQGPLVAGWQRAVEFEQLAEAAGADPAEYQEAAGAARIRVESARLRTREHRAAIAAIRDRVAAALAETAYAETVPEGGDDPRPEAARREALELASAVADAARSAAADAQSASERAGARRRELAALGEPAKLAARLRALRSELPEEVAVGPDAPPSASARLARAGVRVR